MVAFAAVRLVLFRPWVMFQGGAKSTADKHVSETHEINELVAHGFIVLCHSSTCTSDFAFGITQAFTSISHGRPEPERT
jgi:hypothetical protein